MFFHNTPDGWERNSHRTPKSARSTAPCGVSVETKDNPVAKASGFLVLKQATPPTCLRFSHHVPLRISLKGELTRKEKTHPNASIAGFILHGG